MKRLIEKIISLRLKRFYKMELTKLSIKEAHEKLVKKEITVCELVDAYLKNINEKNDSINAYLTIFDDLDEQISVAQEKIDSGNSDLLTGIPIAVKDVIQLKGKRATGGSKILENYVSPYDATVISKLRAFSPVFLGKTNTDEFAQGGSTEFSAYGVTKNPHDEERVAGGSSGGSAAAVSAEMALVALGSDTGGSIREPAGFCGIVGLKPTYGAVSRHGLMAMASSFDCIGPMTKNTEDAEIVFNAIKGKDEFDSTTIEGENSSDVKTIGVPVNFLKEGIDPDVLDNFNNQIEKLKTLGYEIKEIDIPTLEYALSVYYVLVPAEVSSNMARFDGVKYGSKIDGDNLLETYLNTRGELLGTEVKRRIMLGTYILSAGYSDQFYNKAWQVRTKIKEDVNKVFEDVDLIALPVAPTPAFKIGENEDDLLKNYLIDIFTVVANVTGMPGIALKGGFVEREGKSVPTGFQLFAPHLFENRLFEVGKKFETIES